MGFVQGSQNKKDLNVELNLLPVFDVLSVCICFLLMTVVLIEIRSIETKQAIGSESTLPEGQAASLWMSIDERNNISFVLKAGEKEEAKSFVATQGGQINWEKAQHILNGLKNKQVQSAHIMPSKTTKYDQIIRLMDMSKQTGIVNIGLSPI